MAISDIELTRERVGSIASVLERHGFESRKGRILCPNPEHKDKRPGSVAVLPPGTRGTETIYCHACGYSDDNIGLARTLGEVVVFVPKKGGTSFRRLLSYRTPRTRKQIQKATRLRQELEIEEATELEWRFARKATPLFFDPGAVQREIDANREWLEDNGCDIQRIQDIVDRLGEYTFTYFGSDALIGDFRSWKRWVDRAVKELEA